MHAIANYRAVKAIISGDRRRTIRPAALLRNDANYCDVHQCASLVLPLLNLAVRSRNIMKRRSRGKYFAVFIDDEKSQHGAM